MSAYSLPRPGVICRREGWLDRWRRRVPAGARVTARRLIGPAFVLASSAALQLSAGISVSLFRSLGPLATGGLRFAVAAVVLWAIARPTVRGRSARSWVTIVAFGSVLAAMNTAFYLAADRVPLGTVVTIEFLGPFAVAAMGARRVREVAWLVLSGTGVVLLSGPTLAASRAGLLFAALGAVGLALYVQLSQAVGRHTNRLDGLALSVSVAALLTAPLAIPALPTIRPDTLAPLALTAILGVVVAFALEMQAIRRTSAKTVSVLFSIDPAFAALVGLVLLGQHQSVMVLAGMACVIAAGAGVSLDAPDTQPPVDGS